MSSELSTKYLTTEDLKTLQKVLTDSGYTGDLLTGASTNLNVAAKLLILHFQEGVTDPIELAKELERSFGRSGKETTAPPSPFHHYAIRGLPTGCVL